MSKIYYFVDYENVHEAGLEGMNRLPRESEVHLFYSQNANKLNLDLLRFVKAKLEVHRVKPGKQSLDMQMVSYLGYCIGEAGREGKFVLVSKDTDYANTVLFWQEEGVEVRVQPAIREEKNADGMERALKAVKVTRRGKRGGRKTSAAVQEAAPEEVKAEPAKAPVQTESSPAAAPAQPVKEEASAAAPAAATTTTAHRAITAPFTPEPFFLPVFLLVMAILCIDICMSLFIPCCCKRYYITCSTLKYLQRHYFLKRMVT